MQMDEGHRVRVALTGGASAKVAEWARERSPKYTRSRRRPAVGGPLQSVCFGPAPESWDVRVPEGHSCSRALVVGALSGCSSPTGRYLVARGVGGGEDSRAPAVDPRASSPTRRRIPTREPSSRSCSPRGRFAADSIALEAKESFTTYSTLDRDTLVLVLSGGVSRPARVHTRGGSRSSAACRTRATSTSRGARMRRKCSTAEGFDVYLRPSSAFSTLGWFNDPLLSTTLRADTLDLANTVIHELTHNTFYAPGQAVFNESFANFVGARGSAWFFRCARLSRRRATRRTRAWARREVVRRLLGSGCTHASTRRSRRTRRTRCRAPRGARHGLRARARALRATMSVPQIARVGSAARSSACRLDNAALSARRVYRTDLDLFDGVWEREGAATCGATGRRRSSRSRSRDRRIRSARSASWVAATRGTRREPADSVR